MSSIELDIDGPIARLTLDYPGRHNALTRHGLEQMHARLEDVENNSALRVLIVTGTGDETFCSGAALGEVQAGLVDGEAFQGVADRLAALPIPKLAAMNGSAYGGGVELGLCCDFRCGVEGMKIRVEDALSHQRAFLQSIAVGELRAQKDRLDIYMIQARFARIVLARPSRCQDPIRRYRY